MENKKVLDVIELFLSRKSDNTKKNYTKSFQQFFSIVLNKDLYDLCWEDLENIKYTDLLEYTNKLEKKYDNLNTITFYINSLKALFKMFSSANSKIKLSFDGVEPKKEFAKNNKTYGAFTKQEINDLLCYAKVKNTSMYLFFKILFVTAHRLNSVISIRFKDIEKVSNGYDEICILKVFDKTNYFETAIPNELYYELIEYKKINSFSDDENIFKFVNSTVNRFLDKFCKENNIDKKGRNLTVHSIKKTSGDVVYEMSKDIYQVANHLHHTNIETAYQTYINKNKDLSKSPSLNILEWTDEENFNNQFMDTLKNLPKSELIDVLIKLNMQTKKEIIQKINEK